MIISTSASVRLDLLQAEHGITVAPRALTDAERIDFEDRQIGRGIKSARPRVHRNDRMASLLGDSEPSVETRSAVTAQESELAPRDSIEVDPCDKDTRLFAARLAHGRPWGLQCPSAPISLGSRWPSG